MPSATFNSSGESDAIRLTVVKTQADSGETTRELSCVVGASLFEVLSAAGELLPTACAGHGVCHLCRVEVLESTAKAAPTAAERRGLGNVLIGRGLRLACQVTLEGAMRIRIPKRRKSRKG